MILEVVQQDKQLYDAAFLIRRCDMTVGRMKVRGSVGSIDGNWEIGFQDHEVAMSPERRGAGSAEARPYAATVDSQACGYVFLAREKHGLFKSFDYVGMRFQGMNFKLFSILLDDGGKCPIYSGERQVAQIEKRRIVHNDMHNYRLHALDEDVGIVAVLFCAYLYVIGHFKPGVKIESGQTKYFGMTKNRFLLEKYDRDFTSRCSG